MNTTKNLQYLPWTWTVKSSDPNAHCPPASSILGTFATVNVLVSLAGLLFGNRIVTNRISCGFFGKLGSTGWRYMWILTLALQFGSNVLVATIIKHTAGYGNDFSVAQLMFFFIARPRLSWIFMSMASSLKRKTNEKRKISPMYRPGPRVDSKEIPLDRVESFHDFGPPNQLDETNFSHISAIPGGNYSQVMEPENVQELPEDYLTERPWESSFMSQFIAEMILQVINLYTTGRIAHFATTRGYYKINHEYHSLPRGAHLMYAGALLYVVALPQWFFLVPPVFMYLRRDTDENRGVTILDETLIIIIQAFVWILASSTWLGSWLLWSGYVLTMGDLYCPPKLVQQGVIWTTFSSLGIFTGTGV